MPTANHLRRALRRARLRPRAVLRGTWARLRVAFGEAGRGVVSDHPLADRRAISPVIAPGGISRPPGR